MAFCAKCGTPLSDAGVCPSCGYVLPQSKRPVQAENAASEMTRLGNQGNEQEPGAGMNASERNGSVDVEATVTLSQAMGHNVANPAETPAHGAAGQGSLEPGNYSVPNQGPVPRQGYYSAPGQENGNSSGYGAPAQGASGYGMGPDSQQGYGSLGQGGQPGQASPFGQPYYSSQGNGNQGQGYNTPNQGYSAGQGGQDYGQNAQAGGYGQGQGAQAGGQGYGQGAQSGGYSQGQAGNPGQSYGPGPGGPSGQPYYGQPYPRKSSDFGKNLLQWFLGIFKKDPTEIFDTAGSSKSPVWAVYMAVYAFFGALTMACSVGSFMSIFGRAFDIDEVAYLFNRASFSSALITFIGAFLFYVALMFLTSLVVWLVLIMAGKKIPFMSACNITVVAYIPCILASAFSFICSFTIFTGILALLVSSVASIATMILLYCAIHRVSGGQKPVLWIYVAAQAVLKILTVIIAVIFIFIFVFILSAMLASSFNSYMYW